jgi:hypothetical protein
MSFESGVVTYLLARDGLTGLVGQRIYPLLVPKSTAGGNYPAVTYQTVTQPNVHSLDGVSGLAYPRVQFVAWAQTYAAAMSVRDALCDALDGYRGLMGSINVMACLKVDEADMLEPYPGTDAQIVYGRRLDFEFWCGESIPTYA